MNTNHCPGNFIAGAVLFAMMACNNYGLRDKLENPGAATYSDRLHVFVSSISTIGNMSALQMNGCTGSGLAVADCYCQNTANNAGLLMSPTSKFVAFLSSSPTVSDMKCRISGASGAGGSCNPTGSPIWYDTNRIAVAQGYGAGIFPGALLSPLTLTESKSTTPAGNAWTGTLSTGLNSSSACSDWASTGGMGTVGAIGSITGTWTDTAAPQNCVNSYPIYCFAIP